ncbi:MAG: non-canonical purine NTP pyrophosphatase, RdgB/HAM1 family [Rhodospirillaceae bacterium]|nr:non-canonical purine NTP pyrophosphatase, RdgB/HAM1 family [Rhodospirillaceae bacterium]|tara:strand:+ start:1814 stop:2425 length:612 start_codon:yes stop_codon:yes gene_type:complete
MNVSSNHWVLASDNPGKLEEFRTLLTPIGLKISPQGVLNVDPVEETGSTFLENALLKARNASLQTGQPTIADDSGLVVDALCGQPGIRSSRFAGSRASDASNVKKLLHLLKDIPPAERKAHFYCVVVAMKEAGDPAPLIATGSWYGSISMEPRGDSGFGYDPVFLDLNLNSTAAQMAPEAKNRLSHRGQALVKLQQIMMSNSD